MTRIARLFLAFSVALLPALLPSSVGAQAAAGDSSQEPSALARLDAKVREFVLGELARAQPGLRAEVTVGQIDTRLRLASCEQTEVFLRPGARLWGRSFVGYRCLQRPGWSISVPVQVHLYGMAVVAVQALPALQPISATDVELREIELTQESGGVARETAGVVDKLSTRAIEAGQPLALNALRAVPAVYQGDPVKVIGTGNGFSITTDGIALSSAAPGEPVRVRMESGRTIAGIARKGRVVEVAF